MSGVGVSGLLANLPGTVTPYPVLDFSLGLGGVRTVNLVSDMTAIGAQFRVEGMIVYVKKTQCYYSLGPDLVTWTIIANNGKLGFQATWFIDPVNGSDANDGITLGTALKTATEFRARCFPFGQQLIVKQAVTITLVAATAQSFIDWYCNFANDINNVVTITIVCQISSTANITLATSTQTNASTKTRGELTTASGAFVNGERIRATSGTANGASTYSMGLHGGATDTYTGIFALSASSLGQQPAINDTVVVDTLLWTISRFEVNLGAFTKLVVQDCKIVRAIVNGSNDQTPLSGGGGNCTFQGCQLTSTDGVWENNSGGVVLLNCRVPATAKIALSGIGWLIVNMYVQGILSLMSNACDIYGLFINGGNFLLGSDGDFNHVADGAMASCHIYGASPSLQLGGIEAENGPGVLGASRAPIVVYGGCQLFNDSFHSEMWSQASGSGYALGFEVTDNGYILADDNPTTAALTTFFAIAATNAFRVAGLVFPTYSNTPIQIPNHNCGVILEQDSAIVTDAYTYLTGQNGSIGATQLLAANAAAKGTFRFRAYAAPTTTGAAGSLVVNAIFTDDSGTQQTLAVATMNTAGPAGAGASVEIECNGTSAISYSTVLTGGAGVVYTLRIGCELDSKGCF